MKVDLAGEDGAVLSTARGIVEFPIRMRGTPMKLTVMEVFVSGVE